MKIATPAVINDLVWSFASSAFAAILGHIGNDMVAANAVAVMAYEAWRQLGFIGAKLP